MCELAISKGARKENLFP